MTVIQIIEDNLDLAEMLSLMLRLGRDDLEVRERTTEFAAVYDTVMWADVDVAVIDIGLPGVDGRDIAAWLAAHAPHVRRVIYSAQADTGQDVPFADAVLSKNADYRTIVSALALDRKGARP